MSTLMKNEPVYTLSAALGAILGLVIAVCDWQGVVIPPAVQASVIPAIMGLAWLIRGRVTPTDDTRNDEGKALVPAPDPHQEG